MTPVALPSVAVLTAFGLAGTPTPLPGGEARCVRVGAAVLKPAGDPDEANWSATVLSRLPQVGFRLARPLSSTDGRWVVDGWTASAAVDGASGPAGHWADLLRAGRAFHAALADVARPPLLARRTHRWAVADRVAWGEETVTARPRVAPLLTHLLALRGPVTAPDQLVHGDLSGNVLFAAGQDPAVLDFSPYWRPAGYGEAVAVVDGLLWHGAGDDLVALAQTPELPELLLRALLFRLVTADLHAQHVGAAAPEDLSLFQRVAGVVESVLAEGSTATR